MNLLKKSHPKHYFIDMQDELNRIMQDFMDNWGVVEYPGNNDGDLLLKPAIELKEKDGKYEIMAQLPGVEKDNIEVEISSDSITIKAKVEENKKEDKNKTVHRREFRYGKFLRTIQLPSEIDSDQASAEYKNGVLDILLPKNQEESKKFKLLEIKD